MHNISIQASQVRWTKLIAAAFKRIEGNPAGCIIVKSFLVPLEIRTVVDEFKKLPKSSGASHMFLIIIHDFYN